MVIEEPPSQELDVSFTDMDESGSKSNHEEISESTSEDQDVTETIVIETIADQGDTPIEHFTIIGESGSVEFPSEAANQNRHFSEDTTVTLSESYSQDDTFSQHSGMTEELIIIQETTSDSIDDNPDDPQPSIEQSPEPTKRPEQRTSSRKGRKATFDLPMHVLGHDINKPVEPVVNGRSIPKPRLGVKVPYRNLTSQIVSKAEFEKEIMERGRLKLQQKKVDAKFARGLTRRLVKKISPAQSLKKEESDDDDEVAPTQETIKDNSDLLAILEGDGDDGDIVVEKKPETLSQVRKSSIFSD